MQLEPTRESNVAVAPVSHGQSLAFADSPPEPAPVSEAQLAHGHVPVHFLPRTRRSVAIFATAVVLGLITIFAFMQFLHYRAAQALENDVDREGAAAPRVDAVRVRRASGEKLFTLPGEARSFHETTIFARTSGYVQKWWVDIGDSVTKSDILATIETPELDDQLRQAQAKLGQLRAQANIADTAVSFAKLSYDRWAAGGNDGVVSAQERDQKKSELDASLAKLEAAKSEVKLGEAQVQQLQTLEKFKEVRAPFDGVITQRHVDIGDLVTAGSTTNTSPLFTVSQSNLMRVYVDVPQTALPDIHVNMSAYAKSRELGNRRFNGTVDRWASSLDPHSRTMRVEVVVANGIKMYPCDYFFHPASMLHPGMYLQVTFQTNRADPPLRIPPAALAFGPQGPRVAVVDGQRRIHFRRVVIDRDMGDAVEVASGVKEGETVALNVGSQVEEGERVDAHLIDDKAAEASTPARAAPAGRGKE
jgi:RND family efflux transporter MFP subunit